MPLKDDIFLGPAAPRRRRGSPREYERRELDQCEDEQKPQSHGAQASQANLEAIPKAISKAKPNAKSNAVSEAIPKAIPEAKRNAKLEAISEAKPKAIPEAISEAPPELAAWAAPTGPPDVDGVQLKVLQALAARARAVAPAQRLTGPIVFDQLVAFVGHTAPTVRSAIQRLCEKRYLKRYKAVPGRHGWTSYRISPKGFETL